MVLINAGGAPYIVPVIAVMILYDRLSRIARDFAFMRENEAELLTPRVYVTTA